jgi:hypothetical protein
MIPTVECLIFQGDNIVYTEVLRLIVTRIIILSLMSHELLKIIFFVDIKKRIWSQFFEVDQLYVFFIRQT